MKGFSDKVDAYTHMQCLMAPGPRLSRKFCALSACPQLVGRLLCRVLTRSQLAVQCTSSATHPCFRFVQTADEKLRQQRKDAKTARQHKKEQLDAAWGDD